MAEFGCGWVGICRYRASPPPPPPLQQPRLTSVTTSIVIPKGTVIQFRTRSPVSSRTAQLLDRVELEVAKDVAIGNTIVIPRGCQAVGEVSLVRSKDIWGASGRLEIRLVSLNDNGNLLPVVGAARAKGSPGTAGVIGSILFAPLVGFYATGTSAVLPVGTLLSGITDDDLTFAAAQSGSPASRSVAFSGVHEWQLESGTAIQFRSLSALTSALMAPGDLFELEVVDDVLLNGEPIIPRGSRAVGEMVEVRPKAHWGRSGGILASLVSVRINGRVVPLAGTLHAAGDSVGVGGVSNAGPFLSPFGYFVSGTSATIPAGTLILGVTSANLPLASFDPKLRPPVQEEDVGQSAARDGYQRFETPYTVPPPVILIKTRDN